MTFVVWGTILEVKTDAYLKNDICKRISQRLAVVFVGFNINEVFFRKIFMFFRLSRVGYRSRSAKYANYKTMTANSICARLGVVQILTAALRQWFHSIDFNHFTTALKKIEVSTTTFHC